MDGVHAMGPGAIMFTLLEHFRLTGDLDWLKANAPRMKANAEWILRQRRLLASIIPGGERLWSKGLQPAHVVTPDSERMHMQFYETEAYDWLAVKRLAQVLAADRSGGRRQAGRRGGSLPQGPARGDRSLDPAVAGRAGPGWNVPLVHPVRPLRPRVCGGGLGLAALPGAHRGDLLGHGPVGRPADQPRRPALTRRPARAGASRRARGPVAAGEHEGQRADQGLRSRERLVLPRELAIPMRPGAARQHPPAADDVPNFLRSFLNQYAVDIMPGEYTFREHTTGGPPDKIYEESCFLERFRNMLVMEDGDVLWLARATPRAWLEQGKKIAVREGAQPLRHRQLRDRLGRGARQDHRDRRLAVAQSAQRWFTCGSAIPRPHRSGRSRSMEPPWKDFDTRPGVDPAQGTERPGRCR